MPVIKLRKPPLTPEEKKQHQLEAQRRYRAKRGGCYDETQKSATHKYLYKRKELEGKLPRYRKVQEI